METLTPKGGEALMRQMVELVELWGWEAVMTALSVLATGIGEKCVDEPSKEAWAEAAKTLEDLA